MNLRILPKTEELPKMKPAKKAGPIIALCQAPVRKPLQIMSVHLRSEENIPLQKMGIVPGKYIKLHHNDHKGTVVMELEGESFILGRRETRHIKVRTR